MSESMREEALTHYCRNYQPRGAFYTRHPNVGGTGRFRGQGRERLLREDWDRYSITVPGLRRSISRRQSLDNRGAIDGAGNLQRETQGKFALGIYVEKRHVGSDAVAAIDDS